MKRCSNCFKQYDERLEVCPYCGQMEETTEAFFLPPGTVLNNQYYIGKVIGFGGFGITYKAYDIKLDLIVAIKENYPSQMVSRIDHCAVYLNNKNQRKSYEKMTRAFLNEARSIAKLNNCPNIVRVMDYFEANNTAYMVMEFLEGESLNERLKRLNAKKQKMSIDEAVTITKSVLTALKAVHQAGIIHRDIKPGNIFLCKNGAIKLIDFGAARASDESQEMKRTEILTPGYAPPEQYQSKSKQGPFTDLYAVGAVLYQMITGIKPQDSIDRKKKDLVEDAKKYRPEISAQLNDTIMRSIALNPEIRFRSAADFEEAIDGKAIKNVAEAMRLRKRKSMMVSCAIVLSLFIAAFAGFHYYRKRQQSFAVYDTSISVMLPIPAGSSRKRMEDQFNQMTYDFRKDYPGVKIRKVTYVRQSDYSRQLMKALRSKTNAPDLFESSGLKKSDEKYCQPLKYASDAIQQKKNNYYFLDQYIHENSKRIPTTFTIPVIYQNFNESTSPVVHIHSFDSFKNNQDRRYTSYLTDYHLLATYEYALGKTKTINDLKKNRNKVLNSKVNTYKKYNYSDDSDSQVTDLLKDWQKPMGFYLTDSDHIGYDHIRTDYQYNPISSKKPLYGHFNHYYSISCHADDKKTRAASRLIATLLDENAQRVICIENNNGLPFNKNTIIKYQNDRETSSSHFSTVISNINNGHLYRFPDDFDDRLLKQNDSYENYLRKKVIKNS